MEIADILLWTFSLILALVGVLFGIIASINSSRANQKIKQLISRSWVNEESNRYFFENMKNVIQAHKRLLMSLKDKELSYQVYSLKASQSRFYPMPKEVAQTLRETDFKELVDFYNRQKINLDLAFNEIVSDYSLLTSNKLIEQDVRLKLINYHNESMKIASEIIGKYNGLISATQTVMIDLD